MDEVDTPETLQALRFGEQCQRVKNVAKIGQQQITSMLRKIDQRIKELEDTIRQKEHWEDVKTRRVDENIEEGTFEEALAAKAGGETVITTRLVGAEVEREELVELLRHRAELSGEVCFLACVFVHRSKTWPRGRWLFHVSSLMPATLFGLTLLLCGQR